MQDENQSCATQVQRLFRVSDPHGLHMRPAALIVEAAQQFKANLVVQCGEATASGKSLLSLLALCIGPGELLTIVAEGVDASQTIQMLEGLTHRHSFMVNA